MMRLRTHVVVGMMVGLIGMSTSLTTGQPAPGGGNTGVIPRPGESIADDLRDQFGPRVPRTQPGGGEGHKDEIEIAPWSWGEAQIGRYVKKLEELVMHFSLVDDDLTVGAGLSQEQLLS